MHYMPDRKLAAQASSSRFSNAYTINCDASMHQQSTSSCVACMSAISCCTGVQRSASASGVISAASAVTHTCLREAGKAGMVPRQHTPRSTGGDTSVQGMRSWGSWGSASMFVAGTRARSVFAGESLYAIRLGFLALILCFVCACLS